MPRPRFLRRSMITEEPFGVTFGKAARRLVEDDDLRARNQRSGHFDELLGTHAQLIDSRLGPDIGMVEQPSASVDDAAMLATIDQLRTALAPGRASRSLRRKGAGPAPAPDKSSPRPAQGVTWSAGSEAAPPSFIEPLVRANRAPTRSS